MVVPEGLPTNSSVGDREPEVRWAQRAVHLFASSMQLAANSTAPARSLTLTKVLNYSARSYNEALASLVGPESMAVPGRFAPPPPPDNLPDLLSMGVPPVAPELDNEFPL